MLCLYWILLKGEQRSRQSQNTTIMKSRSRRHWRLIPQLKNLHGSTGRGLAATTRPRLLPMDACTLHHTMLNWWILRINVRMGIYFFLGRGFAGTIRPRHLSINAGTLRSTSTLRANYCSGACSFPLSQVNCYLTYPDIKCPHSMSPGELVNSHNQRSLSPGELALHGSHGNLFLSWEGTCS